MGPQGYTGYTGYTGYSGHTGYTGYTGYGDTGYTGYTGYTGDSGAATNTGATGYTGYTGPTGATGDTGAAGIDGAVIFDVTHNGYSYWTIDAITNNPTITLIRGRTYKFSITTSGGAHKFWIKSVAPPPTGSTNEYTSGVTNNGTSSGTIIFSVPSNAPDTLYYTHDTTSSMYGTIKIIDSTDATGPTGPPGPAGTAASFGATGYTGYTGYAGYTGYTGYTGDTGETGYTGYTGYTGDAGTDGTATNTGATGYTGYTGYTGDAGDLGPTGPTGPTIVAHQFFYGVQSQCSYSLNRVVSQPWQILVVVDGMVQVPSIDYEIIDSGATLKYNGSPCPVIGGMYMDIRYFI